MRNLLLITFFFITVTSKAIGLGDWQNQTPGGNLMGDPGGGTILTLTKNSQVIEHVNRWYFYKNHIIGQTSSDFFIANETTSEVSRFSGLSEWNEAIAQSKLFPGVWTRWYSENWKFYDRMLFAFMFIGMLSSLLLLFFLFRRLNRWLISDAKFRIRRTHLIAFIAIVVVIVSRILLDIYPQSI